MPVNAVATPPQLPATPERWRWPKLVWEFNPIRNQVFKLGGGSIRVNLRTSVRAESKSSNEEKASALQSLQTMDACIHFRNPFSKGFPPWVGGKQGLQALGQKGGNTHTTRCTSKHAWVEMVTVIIWTEPPRYQKLSKTKRKITIFKVRNARAQSFQR